MKKEYIKLLKAHSNFHLAIEEFNKVFSDQIEFDFYVTDTGSDGLAIGDTDSNLASLSVCVSIINEKKLTHKEFLEHTF